MKVRLCSYFVSVKAHDGSGAGQDQPQHMYRNWHRAADTGRLDITQCAGNWSV